MIKHDMLYTLTAFQNNKKNTFWSDICTFGKKEGLFLELTLLSL